MRLAILSAPACHIVTVPYACGAAHDVLPQYLADRVANGEAFPEERVVRLPRRFSKNVRKLGLTWIVNNALCELRSLSMDPDANLTEQLQLVRSLLADHAACDGDDMDLDDAARLVDLVEALDGWLSKGGALPKRWQR